MALTPIEPPMARVIDLQKSYGSFQAVKGVSFEIRRGEIFGLLGPNGAGKTTTIGTLAGLLPRTAGTIELGGRPVDHNDPFVRRVIGVVPQDLAIYKKLSGRENLAFFGKLYGMRGQALQDRVQAILGLVGLADRAESLADTYSGGMKRRLNLAAGLMHSPQLLLLDEPTVGVDPQSRNHIFQGVKALNRQGLTVLYTSHYMEEVEALCDRVAIVDDGRLIACDTVPNLVARMGGAVIEIGLMGGEVAPVEIIERLRAFSQLTSVEHSVSESAAGSEGRQVTLSIRAERPELALPEIVRLLAAENVLFRHMDIKQPNLEDVFLSLTGKSLRD